MKKQSIKVALLLILVILAVTFTSSCDMIFGLLDSAVCTHDNVTAGDCCTHPTCEDCGKIYSHYGQHDYKLNIVDPTCLNDGYTEYSCRVCKETYTGANTKALGHSFGEWIFTVHPTRTSNGEAYRTCSSCNFIEIEFVDAHEHVIVYADGKTPTCTEPGWKEYEYCTECAYTTMDRIAPIGHNYGFYTSNGDSTHSMVCSRDASHVKTEPCSGGDMSEGAMSICAFCNAEYEFAFRNGNNLYGYLELANYQNGIGMQHLYRDLTTVAESFYYSNEDLIPEDGYYIIGEFDMQKYSLTIDEGAAVWKIFYVSNPAYYWIDSTVVSRGEALLLTVAEDYATAAYRRICDSAIEDMVNGCLALIDDDSTELEIAAIITAYIAGGMEYAYEKDGKTPVDAMWAHNMSGFAVYGYGVCEAYAKSFMYLALLNGMDCAVGSGLAGKEAHAWNYVKIDGEWYGVDVTWTDKLTDEVVYDDFGLGSDSIFADHTPHPDTPVGVDFIYEAPALSDTDIELTALYADGEYVGLYKSIDEAFDAILTYDDQDAEFTVDVGYYYMSTHTVSSTQRTPDVNKITVIGRNEFLGEQYLDRNSIIYVSYDLTISSNVEFANVSIEQCSDNSSILILEESITLTLSGHSVYIDPKVAGAYDSTVVVECDRGAYMNGGAEIYRLAVPGYKVVFGADSTIEYGSYDKIYTTDNAKVDIEKNS